jgi:hypothetical protein
MDHGLNSTVRTLALDNNQNLYTGGDFIGYCADLACSSWSPVDHVAAWKSTYPLGWYTLGIGANNGVSGDVYALAWDAAAGALYVGGQFAFVRNNLNIPSLARFTPSAQAWSALDGSRWLSDRWMPWL